MENPRHHNIICWHSSFFNVSVINHLSLNSYNSYLVLSSVVIIESNISILNLQIKNEDSIIKYWVQKGG